MKRRSFLAALGLAPLMPVVEKAGNDGVPVVERQWAKIPFKELWARDGGVPLYDPATESWVQPNSLWRYVYSVSKDSEAQRMVLQVRATEADEWADAGAVWEMSRPNVDDVIVHYA